MNRLTLDTDEQVFFYEQDHYYLSNFSAFPVYWEGENFMTAEHAYHWTKFRFTRPLLAEQYVGLHMSAHDAFRIAQDSRQYLPRSWDNAKVVVMKDILVAKLRQHSYVRSKLIMQTGNKELIENSWRDDYWGWGPNRNGQNMLGKLWMQIRLEVREGKMNI